MEGLRLSWTAYKQNISFNFFIKKKTDKNEKMETMSITCTL